MAAPFYSQGDQDIYASGNKFIPQEQYRLGPYTPPAIMGQNTNAGIVNTQAAGSYMGYPSYEAWLAAQGGGGNGGGNEIEEDTFSMGMSPGAMGGKLPGFGNWAKRTAGTLGHIYSQLPTPTNLLMKGIRKWKENREIKKEQQRIVEDRTGIGDHDRGTFTGDHPDAPTKTPEQGGWHPGVGGNGNQGNTGGYTGGNKSPGHPSNRAQGGRIGYAYGTRDPEEPAEDIREIMQDQNIPFSEQVEGDPFQMRIEELMGKGLSYDDAYDIAEMEFQDLFAEGSEQDQGIARLL